MFLTIINSTINLFYPNSCIECGKKLNNSKFLCDKCSTSIERYSLALNKNLIEYTNIDTISTLFMYKGIIKKLLVSVKFNSDIVNATYLGKIIAQELNKRAFDFLLYDYILPVPMNNLHYKKRKFNQLELFLKEIRKEFILPAVISGKKINSNSQVGLNAEDRTNNIKGAFIINTQYQFKAKKILIFDDVVTTGATTNEIAGMLKKRGATKVDLLACCRGEL